MTKVLDVIGFDPRWLTEDAKQAPRTTYYYSSRSTCYTCLKPCFPPQLDIFCDPEACEAIYCSREHKDLDESVHRHVCGKTTKLFDAQPPEGQQDHVKIMCIPTNGPGPTCKFIKTSVTEDGVITFHLKHRSVAKLKALESGTEYKAKPKRKQKQIDKLLSGDDIEDAIVAIDEHLRKILTKARDSTRNLDKFFSGDDIETSIKSIDEYLKAMLDKTRTRNLDEFFSGDDIEASITSIGEYLKTMLAKHRESTSNLDEFFSGNDIEASIIKIDEYLKTMLNMTRTRNLDEFFLGNDTEEAIAEVDNYLRTMLDKTRTHNLDEFFLSGNTEEAITEIDDYLRTILDKTRTRNLDESSLSSDTEEAIAEADDHPRTMLDETRTHNLDEFFLSGDTEEAIAEVDDYLRTMLDEIRTRNLDEFFLGGDTEEAITKVHEYLRTMLDKTRTRNLDEFFLGDDTEEAIAKVHEYLRTILVKMRESADPAQKYNPTMRGGSGEDDHQDGDLAEPLSNSSGVPPKATVSITVDEISSPGEDTPENSENESKDDVNDQADPPHDNGLQEKESNQSDDDSVKYQETVARLERQRDDLFEKLKQAGERRRAAEKRTADEAGSLELCDPQNVLNDFNMADESTALDNILVTLPDEDRMLFILTLFPQDVPLPGYSDAGEDTFCGEFNANFVLSSLLGEPGQSALVHGPIFIFSMCLDKHGRATAADNITLHDYHCAISVLRCSQKNPCCAVLTGDLNKSFIGINVGTSFTMTPAVKLNDPVTVERLRQLFASEPNVKDVPDIEIVGTHTYVPRYLDPTGIRQALPLAIPFMVGLKWYIRPAFCLRRMLNPATMMSVAGMPFWGALETGGAGAQLHRYLDCLYTYLDIQVREDGEEQEKTIIGRVIPVVGSMVVVHGNGASIQASQIAALNDYVKVTRMKRGMFTKKGFKEHLQNWRAHGRVTGQPFFASTMCPYEMQEAGERLTTKGTLYPDEKHPWNPKRLITEMSVYLAMKGHVHWEMDPTWWLTGAV